MNPVIRRIAAVLSPLSGPRCAAAALAAMVVIFPAAGVRADVTSYAVGRYVSYSQTSNAAPTDPEVWTVIAYAGSDTNSEMVAADLSFVMPPPVTYPFAEATVTLQQYVASYYTNYAEFLAAFPATTYTITVDRGGVAGPESGDVFVPEDLYSPESPALTGVSFSRLNGCNPAEPFVGTINGFTVPPGATDGSISVVVVEDGAIGSLWSVSLDPDATSFEIPAGLMQPATGYSIGVTYLSQVLTPGAGFGGTGTSSAEFYRGTGANFTTGPLTPAADIQYYQVSKLSSYTQTSSVPPSEPDFWRFAGLLFYVPDAVTAASISFDAPPLTTVEMLHTPNTHLYYSSNYATQAELDAAYPSTDYTFTLDRGAGDESAAVFLPADLFSPEIPHFTGTTWSRLQNYDVSQPLNLTINGFTAPAGANFVQSNVQIAAAGAGVVFSASMAPGDTDVQIPAGLLEPETTYDFTIQYFASEDTANAGFGAATSAASFIRDTNGSFTTLPACPADFNHSGAVTVQDIFDFLAAYFGVDPRADFNRSGAVSVQDIFDYLAAYFAGCE